MFGAPTVAELEGERAPHEGPSAVTVGDGADDQNQAP
jgi:hypothetical protein